MVELVALRIRALTVVTTSITTIREYLPLIDFFGNLTQIPTFLSYYHFYYH